jgi:hypothetical protein
MHGQQATQPSSAIRHSGQPHVGLRLHVEDSQLDIGSLSTLNGTASEGLEMPSCSFPLSRSGPRQRSRHPGQPDQQRRFSVVLNMTGKVAQARSRSQQSLPAPVHGQNHTTPQRGHKDSARPASAAPCSGTAPPSAANSVATAPAASTFPTSVTIWPTSVIGIARAFTSSKARSSTPRSPRAFPDFGATATERPKESSPVTSPLRTRCDRALSRKATPLPFLERRLNTLQHSLAPKHLL